MGRTRAVEVGILEDYDLRPVAWVELAVVVLEDDRRTMLEDTWDECLVPVESEKQI